MLLNNIQYMTQVTLKGVLQQVLHFCRMCPLMYMLNSVKFTESLVGHQIALIARQL